MNTLLPVSKFMSFLIEEALTKNELLDILRQYP